MATIGTARTPLDRAGETRLRRLPRLRGRVLGNNRVAVGSVLLALIVGAVLLAGVIAPYDPERLDPLNRLLPPLSTTEEGNFYLLGTDQVGRDIFSRVLYGGRVSLGVSSVVVLLAGTFGVALGLVTGYFGRLFDSIFMRLADMQLAIPTILLAIAIAAALGPSLRNLVIVLAITNWVTFARIIRATTLTLREALYVDAARASGASHRRILLAHVLRNAWTPIIVVVTQQIALIIILESSLSFIGVGAPLGTPSWGTMVSEGRDYVVTNHWWLAAFPGLAISMTVLAINFFGDGLRDVLDPRLRL